MDASKGLSGVVTLVVVAAAISGSLAFVAMGSDAFSNFNGNQDTENNDQGSNGDTPVEFRTVQWDSNDCGECYRVDLEAKAPVASDFEADIFAESPDDDGEFGNYVEYNRSDATSGMTQGVDYFHTDGTSTDTLTWSRSMDISSGTYKVAIDDDASSEEYHTLFTEVTIPDTVKFTNYDNNNPITGVSQGDFKRRASYDTDSAEITTINDDAAEFSDLDGDTNLSDSAWDSSNDDETVTVERSIDYQNGVDLLGEISVSNVDGSVNEADLEITAQTPEGEKVVYDKTVAEDGSKVSQLETDIADSEDMEVNPDVVSDLTATLDVEFDGTSATADNTAITVDVDDIYGNSVGTAGSTSLAY